MRPLRNTGRRRLCRRRQFRRTGSGGGGGVGLWAGQIGQLGKLNQEANKQVMKIFGA